MQYLEEKRSCKTFSKRMLNAVNCSTMPDWGRIFFAVLLLSVLSVESGFADGSKDLYPSGVKGKRAYLFSRTNTVSKGSQLNHSWPFRTYGEHFVYVNAGETIALASSAQGLGSSSASPSELRKGMIRLSSPSGVVFVYNYNSSTGAGRIPNRTAELAGPRSPVEGSGGNRYLPHYHMANEAGIWKVEFFPVYELSSTGSYIPLKYTAIDIDANGDWYQPQQYTDGDFGLGHDIAAWDVSVWGDGNWKKGRVYTTVMNLSIAAKFYGQNSGNGSGFYGKVYPLTKDGWVYEVDNNGQSGVYFTFFVNNKGFYKSATDHMPRYKSLDFIDTLQLKPLVLDPRSLDNGTDHTCKMFYQEPDRQMPDKANIYINGQVHTTWLMNSPASPEILDLNLTGVEGTEGHASQKGGYIWFNASVAGLVRITFDPKLDGYETRIIEDIVEKGENRIFWDGKDGGGRYLPKGTVPAGVSVQLFAAEVHFPYIDVEVNPNGIKIRRLGDNGSSADVVYWDDSDITGGNVNTKSNPVQNIAGLSSASNGHKWGRNTDGGDLGSSETINTGDGQHSFGNGRAMDTWAYIPSSTVTKSVSLEVLAVDLGVRSFTKSLASEDPVRPGDTWNYTVEVFNAPGYSDAAGAVFELYLPVGIDITDLNAIGVTGTGNEVSGGRSFDPATGRFRTVVNLQAGTSMQFTIPVTVSPRAVPGTPVDTWATILRPADVYDHDATNLAPGNGGVILPTDPFFECQGPNPNPNVSNPYNRNAGNHDNIPCNNLAFNGGPSVLATPFITLIKGILNAERIEKAGDIINYWFEVSNTGNVALTSVNITDPLLGLSVISGPTYHVGNSDNILNPGEVWRYLATYAVNATDVTIGSVANSATVSAIPSTGGNVSDAASISTMIYSADLSVSKAVSNIAPRVGSTVTFEIEVTNTGPSDATDVQLTDMVPNGYTDITSVSHDGIYSGNTINWSLSIASGDTTTISYQAKVLPPGDGISHINHVMVTDADLYDPDTSDNVAEVTVQPKRALMIGNPLTRSRTRSY